MGRRFEKVWLHRRIVWRAAAVSCVLCTIWLLGVSVWTPAVRVSSIQFRVLFDGAAEGRYPNGAPFSPAEITGTPVVAEVFAANNLNVFGEYEDFKETLFVQPSNPELALLEMEYQARLSDVTLTHVERTGLEEEFKQRRATAVNTDRPDAARVAPRILHLLEHGA